MPRNGVEPQQLSCMIIRHTIIDYGLIQQLVRLELQSKITFMVEFFKRSISASVKRKICCDQPWILSQQRILSMSLVAVLKTLSNQHFIAFERCDSFISQTLRVLLKLLKFNFMENHVRRQKIKILEIYFQNQIKSNSMCVTLDILI
jgi:hypothetical protein